MRRLVVALIAVLLLGACSEDSSAAMDDIKVSDGEKPSLKGAKISVNDTTSRVVTKGDGGKIGEDDVVVVELIAVNGRTGEEFVNTFATDETLTLPLTEGTVLPGWIKGLKGAQVGSRVLVAIPPKDGFDTANEQYGLQADDTMVFLFDVLRRQECADPDTDLPAIDWGGKKGPKGFKATKKTAKKVDTVKCHVANEGDGKKIKAGQNIKVNYHGQLYPDGKVFDSSWKRGEPAEFQIGAGAVIGCWDEGLVGRTVGSRVILVCPASSAYGDQGSGDIIKGGDTLVFAVDLIDAS